MERRSDDDSARWWVVLMMIVPDGGGCDDDSDRWWWWLMVLKTYPAHHTHIRFDLSEAASRREVISFFSQAKYKTGGVQQLKISSIKYSEPAMISVIHWHATL